jgi:NADH:quinone reductase (non-electrogenic)
MNTHTIVIVGGGAGGLELATRLGNSLGKKSKANVVLVDATMTHLWKPRLHEVAAGAINANLDELNYVAHARQHGFKFVLGRMSGLDKENKCITLGAYTVGDTEILPERSLLYDTLVIAVGSQTNDFNTQGAAEHCVFLDKREAAENFHKNFLDAYLAASNDASKQHCSVVIVGAGATGVELAAELVHSSKELVGYGFDSIKPEDLKVTIVEASDRVLPVLAEKSSAAILRQLKKLGIEVLTGEMVTEVTATGLHTKSGKFVDADIQVWSAGIKAPAFLSTIGLEVNRINQIVVDATLQAKNETSIFAFGDCAQCPAPEGDKSVPPRAQAASQQATLLAKNIKLRLEQKALLNFEYKDKGSLISLSKSSSVGQIMGNLSKDFTFEGKVARLLYISLYRMHQIVLHGFLRTGLLILRDRLNKSTSPKLKLH